MEAKVENADEKGQLSAHCRAPEEMQVWVEGLRERRSEGVQIQTCFEARAGK